LNINELKTFAESLLDTFRYAGQKSLDLRDKGLKTTIKEDNTPVTNGDIEVNNLLVEKIESITPNIPIISEETVDVRKQNDSRDFWLIDPIDGTKDYINNRDEFTLNAALIINLNPVLGIINAPGKKRLFYSYGKGHAFEINKDNKFKIECKKKTKRGEVLAVSNSSKPIEEIVTIHKKFNVKKLTDMRSSYKFCVIAAGEFDLYASHPRASEWDIAAGHAIVEHAGGSVTTLEGKKFNYGKKDFRNLSLLVKRSEELEL